MSNIYIKNSTYDYEELKPHVWNIINAIDSEIIKQNDTVLIKPNLLMAASPEAAVLVHPNILKAIVEYILNKGGKPIIGDSPTAGHFLRTIEGSGYKELLKEYNVEYREFTETTSVDAGEPFGQINIATDALKADTVINLTKLKTHSRMGLRLSLNNLFGCIVGNEKANWHLKTKFNRKLFAELLIAIFRAIKPSINIIDGILALEGQGPGISGAPRHLGLLGGSDNTLALDMIICTILGIDPEIIPTIRESKKTDLAGKPIHVNGNFNMINDFKLPDIEPIKLGPEKLQSFVRKHMMQRPVANNHKCDFCGQCWTLCPASAMICHMEKIYVDYDKCIRCYNCMEICPLGAIKSMQPLPGKMMQPLLEQSEAPKSADNTDSEPIDI